MACRIKFLEGEREGETVPISEARGVIVGRSPSNSVYIRDKNVSRIHCQLVLSEQGCLISDLQSTNGTFVNGKRITECVVNPGDRVKVGLVIFTVEGYEPDESDTAETDVLR